jgi:hypothetical protein
MSTSTAPPRARSEISTDMEICMNWIKVEDAHSRRPMWVNLALATAIREERDLVRISFDKDNVVSTREEIATLVQAVTASQPLSTAASGA